MNRLKFMAGASAVLTVSAVALIAVGGQGPATAEPTADSVGIVTSTTSPTTSTSTSLVPGGVTTTTAAPATTTTVLSTTTTSTVPVSAQLVIADALVAVQAQRGVKWSYVFAAGGESFTEAAHAGAVGGTLTDTLHFARSGHVQFVLHAARLFLKGTAYGLSQDVAFKAKYASLEAGKWISASASASSFVDVVAAMTMGGVAGELALIGGKLVAEPTTTLKGVAVTPVKESATEEGTKVAQTVYISAKGPALPVEVIRQVDGIEAVITYSDWGHPPDAQAPKGAVAFHSSWVSG